MFPFFRGKTFGFRRYEYEETNSFLHSQLAVRTVQQDAAARDEKLL